MAKISLKDDQYSALVKAYFAKRSQRQLLNKSESIKIAERLNEKVSLPFLSEPKEQAVLLKIILKIDNYLYESLPNEIYELIHNIDEGFDDSEAAQLAARLSKQAHDDISLPFFNISCGILLNHFCTNAYHKRNARRLRFRSRDQRH